MKDLKWFPGYAITEDWKVWSYSKNKWPSNKTWRFLSQRLTNKWYYLVWLCVKGKQKSFSVHRLVALTFIPNVHNKPCVNHKNWIRNDNRVENLEWCTHSENQFHSFRILWRKQSEKNKQLLKARCSKKVMQLTKEWILCRVYNSTREASKITWLWATSIAYCARWKWETCWGYWWRYVREDNYSRYND